MRIFMFPALKRRDAQTKPVHGPGSAARAAAWFRQPGTLSRDEGRSKPREPRFGFRAPADGSPPLHRVHLSSRWLLAGAVAAVGAAWSALKLPRRWFPAAAGAVLLSAAAGVASAVVGAAQLRYVRFEIPIDGLPPAFDGFRIAQLSDLHLGWPFAMRNTRRAVSWVREQRPDLVAVTGDFVRHETDPRSLQTALAGLEASHGVYAVFGNHDYWDDLQALEQTLAGLGIEVLRNERRPVGIAGEQISLVGIDCIWESRQDIELAMRGVPNGETAIVLAHEPDIANDVAASGARLQLSGHTHGGHIAMPGLGPLFLPRHGLRYARGLVRTGGMWLYVSRGLGGYPLRLGSAPEVTELTLKRITHQA